MVSPTLDPNGPPLDSPSRPVMDLVEAKALERLFEVLASGTRLRLLHALMVLDDPCMGDLADAVGMRPQAVSNQLRRLVDMDILATRRHGNHIHYRIEDANVTRLLCHGLRLNEEVQKQRKDSRA